MLNDESKHQARLCVVLFVFRKMDLPLCGEWNAQWIHALFYAMCVDLIHNFQLQCVMLLRVTLHVKCAVCEENEQCVECDALWDKIRVSWVDDESNEDELLTPYKRIQ